MKKILLLAVSVVCIYTLYAQTSDSTATDSTLQEYAGHYTFPEGSFVTAADISIKDSKLYVYSDQGASPLERKGKDTFAFTQYNGMAYFFRNSDGKVAKIKVDVEGMLLEGSKEGVTAWLKQQEYHLKRKQPLAK